MACENGGSGAAVGDSATSVCVSSISKMRSAAAIACCRFAFTRLSFFAGAYIISIAARNDVKSPVVRRPVAICSLPYHKRRRHADAAEQLHRGRHQRQRAHDAHVRAIQMLQRVAEAAGLALFRAERLDDAVGGERFGAHVRHVFLRLLASARRAPDALAEPHERIQRGSARPVRHTSASRGSM